MVITSPITNPASPAIYGTSTIGVSENWLGTTDANDFVIGTNNIERMRVKQTNGNIGFGTAAPGYPLHGLGSNTICVAVISQYLPLPARNWLINYLHQQRRCQF